MAAHSHHGIRMHLHKDEGADEDVRVGDVLLELLEVARVAQLLKDVSGALDRHIGLARVDALARGREGRLVLRFQHHVHHLEDGAIARVVGSDLCATVRDANGSDKRLAACWARAAAGDAAQCDGESRRRNLASSSGGTLRSSGLELVNKPAGPVATIEGEDERITALLQHQGSRISRAAAGTR